MKNEKLGWKYQSNISAKKINRQKTINAITSLGLDTSAELTPATVARALALGILIGESATILIINLI